MTSAEVAAVLAPNQTPSLTGGRYRAAAHRGRADVAVVQTDQTTNAPAAAPIERGVGDAHSTERATGILAHQSPNADEALDRAAAGEADVAVGDCAHARRGSLIGTNQAADEIVESVVTRSRHRGIADMAGVDVATIVRPDQAPDLTVGGHRAAADRGPADGAATVVADQSAHSRGTAAAATSHHSIGDTVIDEAATVVLAHQATNPGNTTDRAAAGKAHIAVADGTACRVPTCQPSHLGSRAGHGSVADMAGVDVPLVAAHQSAHRIRSTTHHTAAHKAAADRTPSIATHQSSNRTRTGYGCADNPDV